MLPFICTKGFRIFISKCKTLYYLVWLWKCVFFFLNFRINQLLISHFIPKLWYEMNIFLICCDTAEAGKIGCGWGAAVADTISSQQEGHCFKPPGRLWRAELPPGYTDIRVNFQLWSSACECRWCVTDVTPPSPRDGRGWDPSKKKKVLQKQQWKI